MIHGQQNGRARQILVEQIVMHDLEMPEPLARRGVQREHAVREEIHPVPFAAVEIGLGCFRRHVNDPALFIERLPAPRHHARCGLISILRPRLVTHFAGARDEVENPPLCARPDIECADRARPADTA